MSDFKHLRQNFPIFEHRPELVYLDSAATALKPAAVIDAERNYLEKYSSNVGRGLYPLAEETTAMFEDARHTIARFIGASPEEIIFTSGTTGAINTAARLIEPSVAAGASIVTTTLEHHSNFLPWSELAKRTSAAFRIAPASPPASPNRDGSLGGPITPAGSIDAEALLSLIDETTAIVAFSLVSNVTGAITPAAELIKRIKEKQPRAIVIVDAAQAIGHLPIDAVSLDADFLAFSGHKVFAPSGIGILYGKQSLLETLRPTDFGGGMVLDAAADTPEYKETPSRFEAGTPNIGGTIALGTAIRFIETIGVEAIRLHEKTLTAYAVEKLKSAFGSDIAIIGPADPEKRGGLVAFTLDGVHPHDIAHLLGERNICIRAGEHCAAPLHRSLGLAATARISFSVYNSEEDIDKLINALKDIHTLIAR